MAMVRAARHAAKGVVVITSILLVVSSPVGAASLREEYTIRTVSGTAGLPSTEVIAIEQSQDGYLWLATPVGLFRFDGVAFSLWTDREGRPFPSHRATVLFAATDGSMWVGGRNILSRIRDDSVTDYTKQNDFVTGLVRGIVEDESGRVWVAADFGLRVFNGDAWQAIQVIGEGLSPRPTSLYKDRRGNFWLGTSSGLFRRSPGSDRFEIVAAAGALVRAIAADAAGVIWVDDPKNGLRRLSAHPESPRAEQGFVVRELLTDDRGNIWIGTEGDLLRVPAGQFEEAATREALDRESVGTVFAIFQDREHTIWVGTHLGLLRVSPRSVQSITQADGLSSSATRAVVAAPSGGVWVATTGGLDNVTRHDGRWTVRRALAGSISALYTTKDGSLWLAADQGIGRLIQGRFDRLALPRTFPSVVGLAIGDNESWLCELTEGIFRWDGSSVTHVKLGSELGGRTCTSIYTDRTGRTWFGLMNNGLVSYKDGVLRTFGETDGLPSGEVRWIEDDEGGTVWIGATGGLGCSTETSCRVPISPRP
jgi:ligand-binding sensor domain-containing protein